MTTANLSPGCEETWLLQQRGPRIKIFDTIIVRICFDLGNAAAYLQQFEVKEFYYLLFRIRRTTRISLTPP